MASQSTDRRQNLLQTCIKELQSCVDYVQQYSDHKDHHLTALKDVAKKYCEIDIQHTRAQAARDTADQHFDNPENDCTEDVQEIYNKYLEEQRSDASYLNHPIWHKINGFIEGKPDNEEQVNGEEDSDEELECDNDSVIEECILPSQFEPPIDPITKKMIENPCRNRKCGHVYEFSTVKDHLKIIKQNKTKARCPYIGCNNSNMRASFIVKDDLLKQQIRNYVANTSNRSEHGMSTSNIVL